MQKIEAMNFTPTGLFGIYGPPKTYKTTTALAACARGEYGKIAYIDADRGLDQRLSLLCLTPEQREKLGVVEVMPPWAGPHLREGLDIYRPDTGNYYGGLLDFARLEAHKYDLVINDTLSRMADGILRESANTDFVSKGKADSDQKTTKRMALVTGTGRTETVHPVETDYGFAQDRVIEYIQALDEAPCDVLLVTHEKVGQFKQGETVKVLVGGPRTVGNQQIPVIAAMMDVLLRFEPEMVAPGMPPKVKVRTVNHMPFLAGDRAGVIPDGWPLDPLVLWEKMLTLKQLAMAGNVPQ